MRPLLFPLVLAAAVLAGCAEPAADVPGFPDRTASDRDAFERRAADVATTWADSGAATAWRTGFIPLSDLTSTDGFQTGEAKAAYADGAYRTEISLPRAASTGTVRYPDGTTMTVPVVSGDSAYRKLLRGAPSCPNCVLTVTAARLATTKLLTSRGEADVPAWIYTVREDSSPIIRVAVAESAITPIPEVSTGPDSGAALASAMSLTSADGTAVGFTLGVGACDTEIVPMVKEYPTVIVIGGTARGTAELCTMQLVAHPAQVTLTAPVGARPIIDVGSGRPLTFR